MGDPSVLAFLAESHRCLSRLEARTAAAANCAPNRLKHNNNSCKTRTSSKGTPPTTQISRSLTQSTNGSEINCKNTEHVSLSRRRMRRHRAQAAQRCNNINIQLPQ